MAKEAVAIHKTDSSEHRENGWVTYISPYVFIAPDGEKPISISIDEINNGTYNHWYLCRIVGNFEIPKVKTLRLLVCYDGAIAVPCYGRFKFKENVVEFLNHFLCNILLGGIICDAIDARDVVWGNLYKKKLIWPEVDPIIRAG